MVKAVAGKPAIPAGAWPTETFFTRKKEMLFNGEAVQIIHEPAAHTDGDVLVFSHGHLLRVLAARWLGHEPQAGGMFALSTATISLLGWERENPVIERWNEACFAATD